MERSYSESDMRFWELSELIILMTFVFLSRVMEKVVILVGSIVEGMIVSSVCECDVVEYVIVCVSFVIKWKYAHE